MWLVVAVPSALYLATVHFLKARGARKHNSLRRSLLDVWNQQKEQDIQTRERIQELFIAIATVEFPFLWRKALELALYRTYAIPSISKLLLKTGEFTKHAGKRYDDTDFLISEITETPFSSERSRT